MKHFETFDVSRYRDRGIRLMVDATTADDRRKPIDVLWHLLREAVAVSARFQGPPRTGYPGKSAMPDAPDLVTYWQAANEAFAQGTTMQALYGKPAVPQFTAQQISDADFTLWLFHRHALHGRRNRVVRLAVVHAYAGGTRPARLREATGTSRWALHRDKDLACEDMLRALRRLN